jgi:deaminated glutathione amidase
MTESFGVACLQAAVKLIPDPKKADSIIKENVKHHMELADMMVASGVGGRAGGPMKVGVYPEFSLQGLPCGPSASYKGNAFAKWVKAVAREIPGDVTDAFGRKSAELDMYLEAVLWERADDFDCYFETAFITDPKGKLAYTRRRLSVLSFPWVTIDSPHDVYTEYMKKYGPDPMKAFFPVLETPYGVLGSIICCEMSVPEISRALVLNGAEVLLHSTSEPGGAVVDGVHPRDLQRRARASDNMVYLASTNIGLIVDSPMPSHRDRGHSEILDYRGSALSIMETPGEAIISAIINVDPLRERRGGGRWPVTHLRNDVFASVYKIPVFPKDRKVKSTDEGKALINEINQSLIDRRILRKPKRS